MNLKQFEQKVNEELTMKQLYNTRKDIFLTIEWDYLKDLEENYNIYKKPNSRSLYIAINKETKERNKIFITTTKEDNQHLLKSIYID